MLFWETEGWAMLEKGQPARVGTDATFDEFHNKIESCSLGQIKKISKQRDSLDSREYWWLSSST
jgi:hypothetical protein